MPAPATKLEDLRATLSQMGSVLVTFSGGIDSALVLRVATDLLGEHAVGLTAVGPALAETERAEAVRIARDMGARHLMVDSAEIHDPNYRKNPDDRCYFCKTELYRVAERKRAELDLGWIANGTNADDLGDYRPGLRAADEGRVRSPLVEAGMGKADVRAAARELGMDVWDKPASACLASRIPHGVEVTAERLGRIGTLEARLRGMGLRQVRARFHGDIVRVEVEAAELGRAFALRERILEVGRQAGFRFVTLDLAGYRTGSLNPDRTVTGRGD